MSALYIVLPLALLIVGVAVALFIWAVRRGQFDDLDTPARRMLIGDEPLPPSRSSRNDVDPPTVG